MFSQVGAGFSPVHRYRFRATGCRNRTRYRTIRSVTTSHDERQALRDLDERFCRALQVILGRRSVIDALSYGKATIYLSPERLEAQALVRALESAAEAVNRHG